MRIAPLSETGLRLGERLRQLRVGAGLTQSELAGERFSKEYVSQIERGKTRPTRETIDWLADRLGVDPGFLANGVATDERGRLEGALARAEALIEANRDEEAAADYDVARPGGPRDRAARARGPRPASAPAGRRCASARIRPALELLNEARTIVRGQRLLRHRAGERALHPRRLPVPPEQHPDGDRPASTSRSCSRSARACRPTSSARTSSRGAPAAGAASATTRPRARTSSARCSSRRTRTTPRTIGAAYYQASLVAEREGHWVLARTLRREGARRVRGALRPGCSSAQLTNNLGGLNFLLGKTDEAIELLKQAFAIALDTGREADAARRDLLARADSSAHGQHRPGRRAGAARAAAARRAHGLPRRDRERPARPRPLAPRAGPARRGRGDVPLRRGELRHARVGQPSRSRLGRPRRSRGEARRRQACSTSLPDCGRSTSGLPVLTGKEVTTVTKARFITLLLVASVFAYALALLSAVHGFGDGHGLV